MARKGTNRRERKVPGGNGHAMLNLLTVRGYRSFRDYQMTDLARVNLMVGKNNCGKTSILEAIELLVSGDPSALRDSALRRNELTENGADISHVFYGHVSTPDTSFELSGHDDRPQLTATILLPDDASDALKPGPARLLRIDHGERTQILRVNENGVLPNVSFPGTPSRAARFLDSVARSMHAAWNSVLAEGRSTEVVEALQLLEPEVDEIVYPTGGERGIELGSPRSQRTRRCSETATDACRSEATPADRKLRDGMRRLLALSLGLIDGADGCVLIDEIDTGLHWTVMEDMWRLVIEISRRSNVQVFATTHSYDCIRGLGSLVRSRPDLADDLALHKMHRSLARSVCIPGTEVAVAVEQDIEVR